MINIKYCRRCKQPFDMGEGDLCPKCRGEDIEIEEDELNEKIKR